ncbi:unnamed protein product [Victoria cruziana]
MKFTAFSIPSKPSSQIERPSTFCDGPAEEDEGHQYVTEFDGSAPVVGQPKSIIIPRQENTWRPERKMKSIDLQFETVVEKDLKTDVRCGLNLRNGINDGEKREEKTSCARKSFIESLWDQKYKEDVLNLPDEDGPEQYKDVPVESFGFAVLSSYGWSKGKGIGRNAKADVPVYEHRRRIGGFGVTIDAQRQMRQGE